MHITKKLKRKLTKAFSSALIMATLISSVNFSFPQEASANHVTMRQEINIINAIVTSAGDHSAIVQLDTTKYVSPTYYFEVVGQVDSGTLTVALERVGTGTQDATVSVTETSFTRKRSTAFTPPAGQTEYNINLSGGTTPQVKAARIIIIDDTADMTSSQTQFEIGNEETGKSNTSTAELSNPKYWTYTQANIDGTTAFFAEVTYAFSGQTASTTIYKPSATTTTTSYTYIGSPGVTYVSIEAWGGGGGGGQFANANDGGGGGGGGGYARSTTTVGIGSSNTLSVGRGGTPDNTAAPADTTYNSTVVIGRAGTGVTTNSGGAGGGLGANGANVGQVVANGGTGGNSNGVTVDTSGGGGGSGGPIGAGADGTNGSAGVNGSSAGGDGGNGNAGAGGTGGVGGLSAGGAIGTNGTSIPGANATNFGFRGGGGGGGGDDATTGGSGGAPGGGGGGSGNNQTAGTGGGGQIRLTEQIGFVGIALEEDDGNYNWSFKSQIVTMGTSTSPTRVRVSFTPVDGRHYRLVASTTNAGKTFSIYNGKVVVNQSGTITAMEAQYLLANTGSFGGSTGLKDFDTLFDPINEWAGVENTYYHEANGVSSGTGDVKLQDTSGPTDVTDSEITNVIEVERSIAMTMPEAAATLDVNVTGTGTLNASRIIVVMAHASSVPEPVKISSASNQSFVIGQASTNAATITVTDGTTPEITTGNDIRITIASTTGFGMEFDTSVTTITRGGSASGDVSASVTYPSPTELLIDVTTGFSATEGLTISGLKFMNFTAPGKSGSGALLLHVDGNSAGLAAATSSELVTISTAGAAGGARLVKLNKPPNYLLTGGGLVGYWTFDGSKMITNVADSSGQGNNGSLLLSTSGNTSTTTIPGKLGQALVFDGTDDYINAGNGSSLQITSAITVSAWVKGSAQSDATVIGKWDSGTNQRAYVLRTGSSSTNKLRVIVSADGTSVAGVIKVYESSIPVFTNEWNHVAFTFESNTLNLFVNGVRDPNPTKTTDGTVNTLHNSTASQTLGANLTSGAGANFYNGTVDEARVFNRVLSDSELLTLYRAGTAKIGGNPLGTIGPASVGLVGYWTFNGGTMASNITDSSGTGNTGYIIGQSSSGTTTTSGKLGQALVFDGTDDYVRVADHSSLDVSNVTASAWVKTTTAGKYIIAKDPIVFSQLTDGVSTVNNSATASISPTANAQVFLAIAVAASAEPTDSISVSGNNLTWTKLGFEIFATRRAVWVFRGTGASPTTEGITINYTGANTYQEHMWSVDQATGVDANTPIGTVFENSIPGAGTDTSLTVTITDTPDTDDFIYFMVSQETDQAVTEEASLTAGVLTDRVGGANTRTILAAYDGVAPLDTTPSASWTSLSGAAGIAFVVNIEDSAKTDVPYALRTTSGGFAEMSFMTSGAIHAATSTRKINDGEWHHVAGTYDGDAVRIYVDGALQDTNSLPSGNLPTAAGPLHIGADYQSTPANFWNGSLDDVRLFNRALTTSEIAQLFKLGQARVRQ